MLTAPRHNRIEHDGSFTRDDLALGSNVLINDTQVMRSRRPTLPARAEGGAQIEQLLARSEDGIILTVEQIADQRHARLKDSFARNADVRPPPFPRCPLGLTARALARAGNAREEADRRVLARGGAHLARRRRQQWRRARRLAARVVRPARVLLSCAALTVRRLVNERLPTALGWSPASPAHGIIANLQYTSRYQGLEKQRNQADNLPLDFGLLPF